MYQRHDFVAAGCIGYFPDSRKMMLPIETSRLKTRALSEFEVYAALAKVFVRIFFKASGILTLHSHESLMVTITGTCDEGRIIVRLPAPTLPSIRLPTRGEFELKSRVIFP